MSRLHRYTIFSFLTVFLLLQVEFVNADEQVHLLKPADTSSPQATLNSFIDSCNELYDIAKVVEQSRTTSDLSLPVINRMLDCLNLSDLNDDLRSLVGLETAIYLKEVLDRIDLPSGKDIPNAKVIAADKEKKEKIYWSIPNTRLTIAKVLEGPNQGKYLFTPETVQRSISFYSAAKPLPYRTKGKKTSPGFYDLYIAISRWHPVMSGSETSSPRGTINLFLDSFDELYEIIKSEEHFSRSDPKYSHLMTRVLRSMDTNNLPEFSRNYHAREAAVCIKEILDRVAIPSNEEIPGIESVSGSANRDPVLNWQIPRTQLLIARVQEGPRRGEYLFTPESVLKSSDLYQEVKSLPYQDTGRESTRGLHDWWMSSPGNPTVALFLERMPSWLQSRFMGLSVFQWIGIILSVIVGVITIALAFRIGKVVGKRMRDKSLLSYWITLIFPIAALFVPLVFKHVIFEYLTIRGNALYLLSFAADLVFLFTILVVIVRSSTRIAESFIALPHIRPQGLDAHLIRIVCRVVGIGAAVLVFLEGGKYLGFQLTTLLASAGIGGLAIALSAQDMIKGLFGTVTILMDRPFKVGERILINDHDGVVEEIGLRSTKIRTLTNHLVSIPNDQMADSEVENIGRRKFIRRTANLKIPLNTPREKVEKAVSLIRDALDDHEGMDPEMPPRVFFNDFNSDSFNIRIFYWYTPPEVWNFFDFGERINLEICRAFEEAEIKFSLPQRHTYWENDNEKGSLEIKVDEKP